MHRVAKVLGLSLGIVLSLIVASPVAAASTPPPAPTSACQLVESRGWWTPDGVSIDQYRGIDMEACVPLGPVKGQVPINLHVQLRNNHATITLLRIQLVSGSSNPSAFEQKVSLTPAADGYGEWNIPATINTTVTGKDGWQELRFTANIAKDQDNNRQYQSTGWQVYVDNGKSIASDYRSSPQSYWEARGWYKATDYTNVRFLARPPRSALSGDWTFPWACKPSGKPATYHVAYVDANTHAIPMILPHKYSEGSGGFSGSTTIDTTSLANGAHKLLLRCDAKVASGTDSGLLQVPFTVSN